MNFSSHLPYPGSVPKKILKQIYLLLAGCLLTAVSFSQQVTWGISVGEPNAEHIESIYRDGAGDIFTCGEFRGTNVDFDPAAGTATLLSSNGSSDGFMAKYNSNGQFLMAFSIGGPLLDKINSVTTDAAGNIYVTGFFRGNNVDFDPGPGTALLSSHGDSGGDPGYGGDIFLAKYSSTGQYLWAFNIGGPELYDNGIMVKCTPAGDVLLGGYFRQDNVDFDPGPGVANLSSNVSGTAFLAKYNTLGQYQWAFNIGGAGLDNTIYDLELDAAGNIYTTGYYQGTNADFDPGPGVAPLTAVGSYEGFVAKYNSAGQYQFAFSIGGSGLDVGRDLTLDAANNIYVIGDMTGPNIDFDPSPATALLSSNGGTDVFLAKYNSNGQYIWAFNAGSGGSEIGLRVATDNANVFITGGFAGTADFNPSPAVDNLVSNGANDIFLAKYDQNGVYQCAFSIGGSGDDRGWGIIIDGSDKFYLAGGFTGNNTDFAPGNNIYPLTSLGNEDIFLVKYLWPPNAMPDGTLTGSTICPGQPGKLTYTSTTGTSPFIIKYSDGVTTYTQTNVMSGVPFSVQVTPGGTTNYTLVSITDAVRCSPVNTTPSSSATITVRTNCPPEQIINDYTEVLSTLDLCNNGIRVANASAFHVGDTVMIIQMQGGSINTTNTASFGAIMGYNNAGNYEFNYVKAINGNNIELLNKLIRTYDIPAGKVQLIRVPYYDNLTTVNRLTCLPWDGGKGGVLVFNVAHTLDLGTDIDVSGKGFKGGVGHNSGQLVTNCNTSGYVYASPGSLNIAAEKGQGISVLANNILLGRGPAANAGGGGLDHNSGGGGGANGGSGGFGGYQLAACGAAPYPPFENRGIGGINLAYNNTVNRVFMGGGGGAGHANNPANIIFPPSGANGGGIVIISAETMQSNGNSVISNGADAPSCSTAGGSDCHDGEGGGGSGGTVLLNIPTIAATTSVVIRGGKGADVSGDVFGNSNLGPGGGGGGGVFWSSGGALPGNITVYSEGGNNGVCLLSNTGAPWASFPHDPWGSTPGQPGIALSGLQLVIDNVPFKPNIDSVRIKVTPSPTACNSFDFEGLAYTNTSPIASWKWLFGDGNNAATQNVSHTYAATGNYTVKLIVTDINGCKDSITTDLHATVLNFDFTYEIDVCDPLMVHFTSSVIPTPTNYYWDFGDLSATSNAVNPVHLFPALGSYNVRFAVSDFGCTDTITKTIVLDILKENILLTTDTTICDGTTKQLLTVPSLNFCWTPITYLDNPNSPKPITSTPQDITYYFTAQVTGANIIANGDFTQGNTGFTSAYNFATPNSLEGQYFIGTNPQTWNGGMSPCRDHTTNGGNMMFVNGAPGLNVNVWKQTVTVTPNTNYAFSTWIESFSGSNPAQLQFSINNIPVGALITASLPTCNWTQFFTTWNSGNSTSAVISVINKNTIAAGNDFGLDDISFAPVFIKRDSVKITVEKPVVKTIGDITICKGTPIQLTTTGAQTYVWDPAGSLDNPAIANPTATPTATTEYHVAGTTANGCVAKDTVTIGIFPAPVITKSNDITICHNTSTQLFISGGSSYLWTPAATLDNPVANNPIASPADTTKYYVTITDANNCKSKDSILVSVRPAPVFAVNGGVQICFKDSVALLASGGDTYVWQPATGLNNGGIANPKASPDNTTDYSVTISETACHNSTVLSTRVTVLSLPDVTASKSNDLDCSIDQSQLLASGASRYVWTPAATLSNPNIFNPTASPRITTEYVVRGTDGSGCSNNDTIIVKFEAINEGGYLMPNAFTPNGDGKNDCFGIGYWGIIENVEFSIFNRWGQRVFFTKDPHGCWDGRVNGVMQGSDVFVYMIKARTACEPSVFRKGTFVLIR